MFCALWQKARPDPNGSAQLASDNEVDYAIDNLIKDLESVRKKAKEKIESGKQLTHQLSK